MIESLVVMINVGSLTTKWAEQGFYLILSMNRWIKDI